MSVTLTDGAIQALFRGSQVKDPVLQLLNKRQVCNKGSTRVNLRMSDGQHYSNCFLLNTSLNYLADTDLLSPKCVCKLTKTTVQAFEDGRLVVVVLELEILQSAEETNEVIGNPTPHNPQGQSSVSEASVTDEEPGPSHGHSSASPMKSSPMKSSPMKFSSAVSSPMKSSPMKMSPMKISPMKFSPSKSRDASPSPLIPISKLNPYQNKWTIKARVTNKSNIRTWSNSKGEGKLFSFEIVDESGEIRITAFNKEVDKFFSLVEPGKVYKISNATLKLANKQYNKLRNDYEVTLHGHSLIVLCDDGQGVPTVHCDFVSIAELENREKDTVIDVIGVCKSAEDVSRITTKAGREVSKRALVLIDTSEKVVTVTLWGKEAEKFDGSREPVVAIKGARLSDFGGRSLSTVFSSKLMVNPDIPEAFKLRAWYDQKGRGLQNQTLIDTWSARGAANIKWKTLSDVKSERLGHDVKADYFSCVATVVFMRKENCLYQACPSAHCSKKVLDQRNGLYFCEKCNREFRNFNYSLILSVNLADLSDNQWVTCFQETAETLLGLSAEELGQLKDTDEAAFDEVFQKANFKTYIFKNKVKLETYNDESRVKVTVMEVKPIDHREYSRTLLSNIRKLSSSTRSQSY
ncbi:replication protein A 70 kDa DNA-binding subunit-like isoform X2 [Cynoglossus semilaevis]|nr:replication protein A 70 kDa DNA-binding subunit-like isoform X2 [Cynoglossus semilaevis]